MSALFVVSTPIGNMGDITKRAEKILSSVDIVFAEDTRVAQKLFSGLGIKKRAISLNERSSDEKIKEVIVFLREGKTVAYVSDAGTPGICDPGGRLVEKALNDIYGLEVIPVPGVSAVTAALAVSGFPADSFVFLGFPPHKKRRAQFFSRLGSYSKELTVVLYESPHRIRKTLTEIKKNVSDKQDIMIGRELTKKFESIYRMKAVEIKPFEFPEKGEYVLVIRSYAEIGRAHV